MKISSSDHIHGQDPLKNKAEAKAVEKGGSKNSDSSTVSNRSASDTVQISGRAREIERVSEIVKNTPDIRTAKVEKLKRIVDSGSYHVQSEKVAEKIMEEIRNGYMAP